MSVDQKALFRGSAINGWSLFWLVSIPMCIVIIVAAMGVDLSTPKGVSHMIQYSVRWAVPFIYMVVAASSMQVLFPGEFSKWWLRNRKYIGLCFAVAMAWQGLFIFTMSNFFRDYYFTEVFYLRDELEGSTGYIFLAALVVTSFQLGRRHLSNKQWKLIHTCGIYFLWAYPFSVYWWNLSYYENPEPIDYVFYWSGFLAFSVRIAAWGKQRRIASSRSVPANETPLLLKALGAVIIVFGLVLAATGLRWQAAVTDYLTGPKWSADLELWLPFWPFEPYLSLFVIALGTLLATTTIARDARQEAVSI